MALTEEQTAAVKIIREFIADKHADEMVLTGAAGTGKTFALKEAIATLVPKTTMGATIAHAAKNILDDSINGISKDKEIKIECYTIAQLLGQTPDFVGNLVTFRATNMYKKPPIADAFIILVDECSMIDDNIKRQIDKTRPENSKVIYIGDKYQLPPVKSDVISPTFGIPLKAELITPVRFSGLIGEIANFYRSYVDYVISAAPAIPDMTTLFAYTPFQDNAKGRVMYMRNKQEFINYAIDHFSVDPYSTRILAYKNTVIDEINDFMRSLFYQTGLDYQVGEQLIMNKPYGKNVHNGELFLISSIDYSHERIDLGFPKRYGGKKDPDWKRPTYTFDIIELGIKNAKGEVFGIKVVHPDEKSRFEDLRDKIKDAASNNKSYWGPYWKLLSKFASVSRTYATTTHKAQGQSFNSVFVMANDIFAIEKTTLTTKMQSLYVAASRAKTNLYVLMP